MGLESGDEVGGEILEVDGGEAWGVGGIELDFIAGGHPEQAYLAGGVLSTDQADGLLEGQGTGGDLGADEQRERTRLRRVERDAELAGVGVEAPEGDNGFLIFDFWFLNCERRGVRHIGHGGAGGHVQQQLAQFALGGPDGDLVRAFDDAGSRDVELRDLGIEDRFLAFDVAAAGLPADPNVGGRGEDQSGDGVAAGKVTLNGDALGREDVHVEIDRSEIEAVDQAGWKGEGEAALGVALGDLQFVLHGNVEGAAFLSEQLLLALRGRLRRLDELQGVAGIAKPREDGGLEKQRERLALFGLPMDFRGGESEFFFDADVLGDGLGEGRRRRLGVG